MNWKHTAALILGIGGLIIVAAALHAYLGSRIADAQLAQVRKDVSEASQKAEAVRVAADKDRAEAEKRDAERAQQLALTLAAIATQKQQPVSVDELAARISARIPGSPVTAKELDALPNAPSAQKAISDYVYDCDACKVERDSLRTAAANKDQQIGDLKSSNTELIAEKAGAEKERDAALKAAGHGFWKRLESCAERTSLTIATGAAVSSQKRNGAAVGASVGIASCFLFK